jgi:hypothetical protein
MKLPPSLAHWAAHLNIFPEETGLALVPLLQRLAIAIGPLGSRLNKGDGEPDGFDGLSRRGAYDRLLLSELALADEMPEEFTRRAVMGEHLFLNLARRAPTGSRFSLALFDAGPNQLGTPRLAHLAALIVLARRAAAAGASFGWGVIQQKTQPYGEVTESNVMQLLAARSHQEASDAELKAWKSRMGLADTRADVWLVGGRRLSRLSEARGFSYLHVEDPLAPERRQLSLSVGGASVSVKAFVLELPDDRVSTRLLRDPFDVTVAQIQKVNTVLSSPNLLFDKTGTKLYARSEKWGVTAFNVPNSPRAGTGRPKNYRTTRWDTVAAVGRIGRGIALISSDQNLVRLEYGRQGPAKMPAGNYVSYNQSVFYTSPADETSPLLPCLDLVWGSEVAVLDAAGALFRLVKLNKEEKSIGGKPVVGTAQILATDVLAVAMVNSRLVYVGKEWPGESTHIVSIGTDVARLPIPFTGKGTKAFFGYGGEVAHKNYGLLAVEQTEFQWGVIIAKSETVLVKPSGAERVVGVMAGTQLSREPGLVALDGDRRTLTLSGRNWRQTILKANAPIDRVTVSTAAPHIAYSTVNGEVVVYSVPHRADLCRYLQGGKP